MAGWYYAGPDSESSTDFERNEVSRQINAILARLGSGWMIQVEAVRVPATAYPARNNCHFPDKVSALIDNERRKRFEAADGHYESQHAIILTYREPEKRKSGLVKYVYSDDESRATTFAERPVTSLGLCGSEKRRLGLKQRRHLRLWFSKSCTQPITKLTVHFGGSYLHEHVGAMLRPPHLLLLHHALGNQ